MQNRRILLLWFQTFGPNCTCIKCYGRVLYVNLSQWCWVTGGNHPPHNQSSMLLVILQPVLVFLVFYLNKFTRAHKTKVEDGLDSYCHPISETLNYFLSVSHSVHLWFPPCCAVVVQSSRFVAFVLAVVANPLFFSCMFILFCYHHSTQELCAVI